MDREQDIALVIELGRATRETTGIGPIPEFTLGQTPDLFCED